LLKKANDKFIYLMKECKNNRGCDRHLFGLAIAATVSVRIKCLPPPDWDGENRSEDT